MRVKMPTTKGGGNIRLAMAVQLLCTFVGLTLYGYVEPTQWRALVLMALALAYGVCLALLWNWSEQRDATLVHQGEQIVHQHDEIEKLGNGH